MRLLLLQWSYSAGSPTAPGESGFSRELAFLRRPLTLRASPEPASLPEEKDEKNRNGHSSEAAGWNQSRSRALVQSFRQCQEYAELRWFAGLPGALQPYR